MLVGSKNCILKKHSGGEVGVAEFRESEKRVWGLSLLWWSGLVGNLALLLPPLSDTLAPGIEGSPVFLFRHTFKTCFLPQPSQLIACMPTPLFSHHTGDFTNYARLQLQVLLLSKSYLSCSWTKTAICLFGIEFWRCQTPPKTAVPSHVHVHPKLLSSPNYFHTQGAVEPVH